MNQPRAKGKKRIVDVGPAGFLVPSAMQLGVEIPARGSLVRTILSEFSRIMELHGAYLPKCKLRCIRIEELNDKLTKAIATTSQMTPEIETLLAERGRARTDCQTEMLKHFLEVSRTMPSEQGKRYLAWVLEQTGLREQSMNHGETAQAEKNTANHLH